MTALIILAVVILATLIAGRVLNARSGTLRAVDDSGSRSPVEPALHAVGVGSGEPVVLHFSAPWCGPCAAVRRAIEHTLGDDPSLARDVELDFDEFHTLANQLGVLSLPTTFVFDGEGRERFRASGVPSSAHLRATLAAL